MGSSSDACAPSAGSGLPSASVTPQPAHCERGRRMVRSAWSQGSSAGTRTSCSQGWSGLPAVLDEEVRRGGEHVRHAAHEVAAAVAVIVDRAFHVVGGDELHLADLAGPGPDHVLRGEVAAVEQHQCRHELGAEHVRPAAVIGKRGERLQRPLVAEIGAEIGLQPQKATMTGPGTP